MKEHSHFLTNVTASYNCSSTPYTYPREREISPGKEQCANIYNSFLPEPGRSINAHEKVKHELISDAACTEEYDSAQSSDSADTWCSVRLDPKTMSCVTERRRVLIPLAWSSPICRADSQLEKSEVWLPKPDGLNTRT